MFQAVGSPLEVAADEYRQLVVEARLRLLRMHHEAGVGHIGGNLSALDALLCLHHTVLGPEDVFVLSKGHAAGALYVTLWSVGQLSEADLQQFHGEGTKLAGHPAPGWLPGIPLAAGSLGHGVSVAAGMALARKLQGREGSVYCLTSDGEWQEGSSWEALIFGRHHSLDNLTVLVDANGLQGFGTTDEVASMGDLAPRFESFGWSVCEVDGHDAGAIHRSVTGATPPGPHVVILRTVKGKGVSFMENKVEWHYLPLTDELYASAVEEIGSR